MGSYRQSAAILVVALAVTPWLHSATPLGQVRASPDITVVVGGLVLDDHGVFVNDFSGVFTSVNLGVLPAQADVVAYHLAPNGDHLFSMQTTVSLGGTTVESGDVVRYNGATYVLEFDASVAGVGAGIGVDGLSTIGTDLLLSFDITGSVGGVTSRRPWRTAWTTTT